MSGGLTHGRVWAVGLRAPQTRERGRESEEAGNHMVFRGVQGHWAKAQIQEALKAQEEPP